MTGVWHCSMCGETYTKAELRTLEKMGEDFLHLGDTAESNEIICPDCRYRWDRMSEDEKFDALMKTEG